MYIHIPSTPKYLYFLIYFKMLASETHRPTYHTSINLVWFSLFHYSAFSAAKAM